MTNALQALVDAHGCAMDTAPNGLVAVTGDAIEAFWRALWREHRVSARFVSSHKINGVETLSAPRVEIHPQVAARLKSERFLSEDNHHAALAFEG